jgi:NADH-quinone oxidoreductase subunit G
MPKITLNGQSLEVESSTTIIEAGDRLGIHIPRFCYHPHLSIDGNCRMCLVELEGIQKLLPACATYVDHDMVVRSDTPRVRKMVKGVLEFLLVHHPIDCPICDQSGECYLQDYYVQFGLYKSRFPLEDKIHKVKVKDVGGDIVLDAERCVLCTRCMRFLREVTGTDELNLFGRGSHTAIDIYPDQSLYNRYTCNLADICPVGALTSKDFRFQCRVWYLKEEKSICPGCATGCNVFVHHHEGKVWRMKPRLNEDVNGPWMCDIGRFSYTVANEKRIEKPRAREGEERVIIDWDAAFYVVNLKIDEAKRDFGPGAIAVIASPRSTNEELYLVKKLAFEVIGTPHLAYTKAVRADDYHDDILVNEDKNANSRGAFEIGIYPRDSGLDFEGILKASKDGRIKLLIVMGNCLGDLDDDAVLEILSGVEYTVNISPNESAVSNVSSLALPSASFSERGGTYTNTAGRVQRFHRAYPPRFRAREDVRILTDFGRRMGADWEYKNEEAVFNEMAQREPFFSGLTYRVLGDTGFQVGEK